MDNESNILEPLSEDDSDDDQLLSLHAKIKEKSLTHGNILLDDSLLESFSCEGDHKDSVRDRTGILSGISSDEDREEVSCGSRKSLLDGISSEEYDGDDEDSGVLCLGDASSSTSIEHKLVDKTQIAPGAIFDTHCHLEFIRRRFGRDISLEECLEIDGENLGDKFGGAIVNFCQPSEWGTGPGQRTVTPLLRNSAKDARVGITIGCHPHFADQMTPARWAQIETLISSPSDEFPWLRIVAVGECGLDYSRKNTVPVHVQKRVFIKQIKLAMKYKIPLVLHIRDAELDGLEVMKEADVPKSYPIHRHCFGGDLRMANVWLEEFSECKIGVTNAVNNYFNTNIVRVIQGVGAEKIILETDAPYFVPTIAQPKYQNCSFPSQVVYVAAKVAELKGMTLPMVLEQNVINSQKIYKRFFEARKEVKTYRVKLLNKIMPLAETSVRGK